MAEDPPPEHIAPTIDGAIDNPQIWVIPFGRMQPILRQVFVSRTDHRRAYQVFPPEAFPPIELSHGGPVWGHVYKGYIISRGGGNSSGNGNGGNNKKDNEQHNDDNNDEILKQHYQEPAEPDAQIVAIKRLQRHVVDTQLQQGSMENPYREIYRMQQIGDNYHVLGIIDALQSEEYLYICTPWANVGSLSNIGLVPTSRPPPITQPGVPRELPLEEERARRIFRQMMEALEYLHDQQMICHRDIKPANFLVNNAGRVLLADLAMTFPMPQSGMVNHIGHFGTPPYWVPEILAELPFDARGCDLWACMISLYNLVTGLPVLYRFPHHSDRMFCFAIMAGGLGRNMNNPLVQQVAQEASVEELVFINEAAIRITNLTEELLEMFENTLRLDPNQRWTRQDVMNCAWMNAPP